MNQTTAENIAKLFTYYSTWVAAAASFVAGYWLQLSPDEQAQILAQWPVLKHYGPIFAFVAFAAARVKAQGKPEEPAAAPAPASAATLPVVVSVPPLGVLSVDETRTVLEAARILAQRQQGAS